MRMGMQGGWKGKTGQTGPRTGHMWHGKEDGELGSLSDV